MNIAIGHSKSKVLRCFDFRVVPLNLLYIYGLKLKFYGFCANCKLCELLHLCILCVWANPRFACVCVCLAEYNFLFFDRHMYYLQLNKEGENIVTLFKVNTYNLYEV